MTLIEEVKVLYSAKKNEPTVKDTFLKTRGQAVTLDYFLYTCLEQEHTLKHLKKRRLAQFDPERYPLALKLQDEKMRTEQEDSEKAISDLQALFLWYKEKHPELSLGEPFDYVRHAELLRPLTFLFIDLRLVLYKQIGIGPSFFGLKGEENVLAELLTKELENQIKSSFPDLSLYLLGYCDWAFAKVKRKELDLKSIPPVGRFLPLLYRSQRKAERDAERGKASKKSGATDEQLALKTALQEVERAIEKLRGDKNLNDILLNPQNSFIRRQQHEKVKSLGFNSQSSGEGQSRALQILRT